MKTPAGFECRYFYGNYHRGRVQEECRLVNQRTADNWKSDLCKKCPVPSILRANACENMVLSGDAEKYLFGLIRRMKIKAYCKKSGENVTEPEIGCGQCHPLPDIFKK